MNCCFLSSKKHPCICRAYKEGYMVPSVSKFQNICTTEAHELCFWYLESKKEVMDRRGCQLINKQ